MRWPHKSIPKGQSRHGLFQNWPSPDLLNLFERRLSNPCFSRLQRMVSQDWGPLARTLLKRVGYDGGPISSEMLDPVLISCWSCSEKGRARGLYRPAVCTETFIQGCLPTLIFLTIIPAHPLLQVLFKSCSDNPFPDHFQCLISPEANPSSTHCLISFLKHRISWFSCLPGPAPTGPST